MGILLNAKAGQEQVRDIFADDVKTKLEYSDEMGEHAAHPAIGRLLSVKEHYELASREKTDIIYVLGASGSGKTTFETMLYMNFLQKADPDWLFSGSRTLSAFELRKKYVSAQTGASSVNMARTRVTGDGRMFLHMELCHRSTRKRRHVLLTDISGETYMECKDRQQAIEEKLPLLEFAKHILIFIDSGLLLKAETRQIPIAHAVNFLQMLRDSDRHSGDVIVDIVISKSDRIASAEEKDRSFAYGIEKQFSPIAKYYDMKYYWIEALNTYEIKCDRSIQVMDFLKVLLKDPKRIREPEMREEAKIRTRNEANKLRKRWLRD